MRTFVAPMLSLALVVIASTQCRSSGLPESRPDDFSIELSSNGGMVPAWDRIEIAAAGCSYTISYQQSEARIDFSLSPGDLDALYQFVRENRFDHITTHDEEVYDRGGASIELTAGGERYVVRDSGLTFVDAAWRDEWQNVHDAVRILANRAAEERMIEVPVAFDESVHGKQVMIQRNDASLFSDAVDAETSLTLRQIPGDYVLVVGVMHEAGGTWQYASGPYTLAAGNRVVISAGTNGQPILVVE